ncbi:MAG: hypothetical protein AAGI24_14255 [Pseudomonadota bacterium]
MTLMIILLFVFGGVALMVLLGERFASPMEPEKVQRVSRWILPLVAVAIVLQILNYFF